MIVKNLYLTKNEPIFFEVAQGAAGVQFGIRVQDYTIPEGAVVNIYVSKPDGTLVYNAAEVSGNTITVTTTTQMTAVVGRSNCQVQILSTGILLRTFVFALQVKASIIDETAIESTDEFGALETALQTISQYDAEILEIQNTLENYHYNPATNSFEIYAGAANIRMSESESVFNVWLSDNNRITLGGPNSESQLVTLRAGNSYLTVNNTAGNATLLLSDTRYININSSVVYLKSGDVTASLNDTYKRFIINASGGLYVNGTLVDPTTTTSSVSIKIGSGSTYSGTIVRNGKIRIYNFYYEVSSPVGTINLTTPIGTLSADDKPYAEETGAIVGLTSSAWSSATIYPMAVMVNNAGQILMRGNPSQIALCNVFRGQIVWSVS